MRTKILTDREPLEELLTGAEKLYKAVSTTMGPRGNNVIFRKNGGKTGVTHDGVTVAKAVKLNDATQDIGADLLREAAMKLDVTTGDGTTTVTVLAYHILKEAAKQIKKGKNPQKLRLELEQALEQVLFDINIFILKATKEQVIAVATVAAGDPTIGGEVGTMVYKAGKDTPVVLGFAEDTKTYHETINGFKIDSGAASPYLLEGAGTHLEAQNMKVVVVDAALRTKEDIVPILQTVAAMPPEERKFLLVVEEIAGDALSLLIINRLKGFGEIAVCRVPQHIQSKEWFLQDVAVATGAKVLSRNTGHTIASPSPEDFGTAERVIVELDNTVIIGGGADPAEMKRHITMLKTAKKTLQTKKLFADRLAQLQQKAISIRVGGRSETEAEERHYRYEDAVGAARAALRMGIVPGGGTMLYDIGKKTMKQNKILGAALQQPMKIVLGNAGIKVPRRGIYAGMGIDVLHPEKGIHSLMGPGILDPAQSEIESVKTAVTIAGLLMTSGAMVVDVKEPSDDKAPTMPSIA